VTVTIRHWGGQTEDVPDDVARRLIAGYPGYVVALGPLAPAECAAIEPSETAMLRGPRKRKGGGKMPKKPKGGKGY